jgi:AraC-like DNA-binding protein
MVRGQKSQSILSSVWQTPDLGLGFHHFDYSVNQYDGLTHTHAEYCIVMCLEGTIEVIRGEQRDVLETGEILVVNPGDLHRCRFGLGGSHSSGFTLILRPAVLRSLLEAMSLPYHSRGYELQFFDKHANPHAFALVQQLIGEYKEQRKGFAVMIEALVRMILVDLFRSWPADSIQPVTRRLAPQLPWVHMHRAMEYMNGHGKGAFRLSELCVEVGVSPSRFIPLFKNSAGISPHSYYNSLLVHKARRLLQVERCSTKEAAYALGFKSVSHFCALFHQLTGATPKAELTLETGLIALDKSL